MLEPLLCSRCGQQVFGTRVEQLLRSKLTQLLRRIGISCGLAMQALLSGRIQNDCVQYKVVLFETSPSTYRR